ncbi:MAG: hypothetical protein ABI311_01340 [Gemmatimonadaceae bacterium]
MGKSRRNRAARIAATRTTPVPRASLAGDTLLMRHGQLIVNGTDVPSPNAFVLPDTAADEPQASFAWQHQIEIRGSRFGPPMSTPSVHEWGPLVAGEPGSEIARSKPAGLRGTRGQILRGAHCVSITQELTLNLL